MRAQPNAPHLAIVGIGINVNHAPEDFSEELRSRAIASLAIWIAATRETFAAKQAGTLSPTAGGPYKIGKFYPFTKPNLPNTNARANFWV